MPRRQLDSAALIPWIEVRYDRSEGPGGQNVNKANTRATLLFDFHACPLLSTADRHRLRLRLSSRLARDGRLRVVSQRYRTQRTNRAAALERLVELLDEALHVARVRRATRPTLGSRERRLQTKRQRGEIKRQRQRRPASDE